MPYNHHKINELDSGWYVVFKDGSVITEAEMSWISVPHKKDIQIMGIKRMNKHYEISGKDSYCPPGETHCRELCLAPGDGKVAVTKQTRVGWYIGYYDQSCKVLTRISAVDGSIVTEKIPYN